MMESLRDVVNTRTIKTPPNLDRVFGKMGILYHDNYTNYLLFNIC